MPRLRFSAVLPLVTMSLVASIISAAGSPRRSLEEFGDISTPQAAQETLASAVQQLVAAGGGILEIPPNAPDGLDARNLAQTQIDEPTVTIIDYRKGYVTLHLPSIGRHQTGVWAGTRLERVLNLAPNSLPHCGIYSNQAIQNYMVSGASSYMHTLREPVSAGKDQRCYVDTIRGIWVGAFLNVTGAPMSYTEPYDRIHVKSIGYDPQRRCNYFTADFSHDHPAGALVYNKHVVNGLQIEGYSNCDNQSMELQVSRSHYAVGDCFVISGTLRYQGDIFSGFGDEGGIVINAETIGDLNSFHSTVESFNPATGELVFAPGVVNAHALTNSRPIINMNREKWITQGTVMIVPPPDWAGADAEGPRYTFRGQTYPSRVGGPGNVFNYVGGLILGSPDCPWTEDIIGRYFAIMEPSEYIEADDSSSAGGYATLPGRPIYRWYLIRELIHNPDGTKVIKIERVRWSCVAAGAPRLFNDENYTYDGHERPLKYAIAPGAYVCDISKGWSDSLATGGWIPASAPRTITVVPNGDRGTRFDFEPGDPIEQAVGPDPWQPRPLRIRQFDQMPSTMVNASIEVEQLGRVQVPYGIALRGIISSTNDLATRKDRKPPYGVMVSLESLAEVGVDFAGEVTGAAIRFRQPGDRPQPIRWRTNRGNSQLTVPPDSGDLTYEGGDLDLSGGRARRVTGLSATPVPANNLRGINVPVNPGTDSLRITFDRPEVDAVYAVSVTPSWMTAYCVPEKTPQGFLVRFATQAPQGATLDWVIVR